MLYVLQAVFNGFLKTTGSCDFRDVRQKVAAEQIAKASDFGKTHGRAFRLSSNNSVLKEKSINTLPPHRTVVFV